MRRIFSKNVLVVGVSALALVAMSATVALAAPVLQPGTTSAPGMSGTCTDCHTYATASTKSVVTPVVKPVVKTAPLIVSRPYTARLKQKAGKPFSVWGYFPTKLAGTTDDTLTITVQRKVGHKWTTDPSVTTTAALSTTGKFQKKINYTATLTVLRRGNYRMRATLDYIDANNVQKSKRSSWQMFSVRK